MNPLLAAASELQQFLTDRGWKFCIIGGLAVMRWGQPRATQDVDVSLLAGFGTEAEFVDPLLDNFAGRLDDARDFAIENRVLLVRSSNNISLDIALAGFPFEERVIERASEFSYAPDVELMTASAEDLILLKSFAGRDQDWSDVEGIINRQGNALDWQYIDQESELLCEIAEDSDMISRLDVLRRKALDD